MIARKAPLTALFFLLVTGACPAQDTPKQDDLPRAAVAHVQKVDGGGFLFAIRIYAPKSKALHLFRRPAKAAPAEAANPGADDPRPFSLAGSESTLEDLYTGMVYASLDQIPFKPYVGPMTIVTGVPPGGRIQLGVAFPPIPPPPEKDRKKLPYQLLLKIPSLKIQTKIEFDPDTLKPIERTR